MNIISDLRIINLKNEEKIDEKIDYEQNITLFFDKNSITKEELIIFEERKNINLFEIEI